MHLDYLEVVLLSDVVCVFVWLRPVTCPLPSFLLRIMILPVFTITEMVLLRLSRLIEGVELFIVRVEQFLGNNLIDID